MKKLLSFVTTVLLTVVAVVTLASCAGKNQYSAQDMANAIQFPNEQKTVTFQFPVDKTVERLLEGSDTEKQTAEIKWESTDSRIKVENNIVYPTFDPANEKYATIKATVNVDGESASTEFKFSIAKESKYDEFVAAKKGDAISVSGYIAYLGEYSTQYKNFTMHVVSKDKAHSYYAYRAACNPEVYQTLKVGQLVGLTGTKGEYNGPQLEKASVSVLTGDSFTETAVELTAEDCATEDTITAKFARLVSAKGIMLTSTFDAKENQFEGLLGDKTVVLRLNKYFYEGDSEAKAAVLNKLKALNPGDTIDVKGYLSMYAKKANINVVNADDITVKSSNPDKAALAISETKIKDAISKADLTQNAEISLAVEEGVTPEFTLSAETPVFAILDNKLVVKPTAKETKVTLNVKLSKGSESLEFNVDLSAKTVSTKFDEFINATSGTVIENITAVVTSVHSKADKKGNIYAYVLAQDSNGAYYIRHKVQNDEEMNLKFEKGHTITISKAKKDIFNGLHQLKLDNLDVVTKGSKADLPQAKELTEEIIKDETQMLLLQSSYVKVTGVVEGGKIKVGNTLFTYFADDKICGTKPEKLVDGTTVTVSGFIGYYNGYQINPASADSVVVAK